MKIGKTMSKPDFVRRMAQKYNITLVEARDVVKMYNGMIEECILSGTPFKFLELYQLDFVIQKSKKILDMKTKEEINTRVKLKPIIKISKKLKEKIEDEVD